MVQDFCPLQIKITQCPGRFRLNTLDGTKRCVLTERSVIIVVHAGQLMPKIPKDEVLQTESNAML